MTRTVGQGACADCWQVKTEAGRPVIRAGRSRTDPLLDLDLGWFELLPGWMWLALALGCGATILLTIIFTVA
jgi:hypothetical protein